MQHQGDLVKEVIRVIENESRWTMRRHLLDEDAYWVRVHTKCLLCSREVDLRIPAEYDNALEILWAMDDMPMSCGGHVEFSNWGVHWSFDDALSRLFPNEHIEDSWPTPEWYSSYAMDRRADLPMNDKMKAENPSEGPLFSLEDLESNGYCPMFYKGDYVVMRSPGGAMVSFAVQRSPRRYFGESDIRVI